MTSKKKVTTKKTSAGKASTLKPQSVKERRAAVRKAVREKTAMPKRERSEKVAAVKAKQLAKKTDKKAQNAKRQRPAAKKIAAVGLFQVERLAVCHCSYSEIAAMIGVSMDTLVNYPGFEATYMRGWQRGKAQLRRTQYMEARHGSSAMLVWLGKQCLGQRDGGLPEDHALKSDVVANSSRADEEKLKQLPKRDLKALERIITKAYGLDKKPETETVQ